MKILVISAAFPPLQAGEADYTLHVCESLARRHTVDVLTTRAPGLPTIPGVTVHPVMKGWGWAEMPRLAWAIRKARPDVILLHYLDWLYGRHPMINLSAWVARFAAPRAPFVTLFFNAMGARSHDASAFTMGAHYLTKILSGKRYSGFEFGTLLADSDRLIVFSDRHGRSIAGNCAGAETRTALVPAFALLKPAPGDRAELRRQGREKLGIGTDEFVFANFGYAYPGKGLDVLIQAFEKMTRRVNRPSRLVLIGGSLAPAFSDWANYTDCLKHLAWSLRIESKVIWAGGYDWNSNEPSLYLHAADACVLPFDVGLALNNSSAATVVRHGLPLLSTVAGELEPAFVPEMNCLLSLPRDSGGLAANMARVMEDPALAARLSEGAERLSQEWFSSEKALDRIEDVLTHASVQVRRAQPGAGALVQET